MLLLTDTLHVRRLQVRALALAGAGTAGERYKERLKEELGVVVVVGPWTLRPAGGAGQTLLAFLPCIDFYCSVLLRSAVEAPSRRG